MTSFSSHDQLLTQHLNEHDEDSYEDDGEESPAEEEIQVEYHPEIYLVSFQAKLVGCTLHVSKSWAKVVGAMLKLVERLGLDESVVG